MTDAAQQTLNSVEFDEMQLADASVTGDTGAFEILYAHYFPRVRGFCQRKLGDRELAEDIAQEAFARAFERIGAFGGPKHFGGWVSTIAANLCTDHLRRRKHTPISLELVDKGPSYEVDPIRNLQRQDNTRIVRGALDKLEPRHAEALMLKEVGGASCASVGAKLGISEVAAESLLARARRRMRKEIATKAVPADLFGVAGVGFVPMLARAWKRTRDSASRRLTGVQATAARGWEVVATPVASVVDGGKGLVVAVGAGLAISAVGGAAPQVSHPDPMPAMSIPAPSNASGDAVSGDPVSRDGASPVSASLQTEQGRASVGGSVSVGGSEMPGGNASPSGELDLGLDTDPGDPARLAGTGQVMLNGIDGKNLIDTGERQVKLPELPLP